MKRRGFFAAVAALLLGRVAVEREPKYELVGTVDSTGAMERIERRFAEHNERMAWTRTHPSYGGHVVGARIDPNAKFEFTPREGDWVALSHGDGIVSTRRFEGGEWREVIA
jgi:hypothetical protein